MNIRLHKFANATCWSASSDASVTTDAGAIVLSRGEIVVCARALTNVRAGAALITLSAGSTACISVTGDVVAVRALYEEHKHSVSVTMNQRVVKLATCGEFIGELKAGALSRHLNGAPQIARRQVNRHQMGATQSQVAEVSFPSLLQSDRLLHDVFYGSQPEQVVLSQKITKLMAAMSLVTANHGPFTFQGEK
jgi:hypothetical protein